jgi:hypothetical protein
MLRRGPVVGGKPRWEPYLHILTPKAKMYQSDGGWDWFVCRPHHDEAYIQGLVNAIALEPRWTNDGKAVLLLRKRMP